MRWYTFGEHNSLPNCVKYGSISFINESDIPVRITFVIKSNYSIEKVAMSINHNKYRLSYNTNGIFTITFNLSQVQVYSTNDTAIRVSDEQMVIVANILRDAFDV